MRSSGVLLPITSLASKYGIGCFSKNAYEFIDILKAAGQKYWQILPLGVTSYGDSPYQSFSTYAGNPYFIDLEQLIDQGLLTVEDCENRDFGDNPQYIDYGKMYLERYQVLKKAFLKSQHQREEAFLSFEKEQSFWLEDFSLFMAIKEHYNGISWIEWPEKVKIRDEKTLQSLSVELSENIKFHKYLQYEFMKQWEEIKSYANENKIEIVGDIPIYVALDSADVWANPKLFQFDENGQPTKVAGCPPDGFSATGQLWGNPLYDWAYHKKTDYAWWIKRMKQCSVLYDVVRIDHFRGFDEYYAIPFKDKTAEFGQWEKGPGIDLFLAIKDALGDLNIIAEDLGFITPSVKKLVKDSGFPGMKVLEFAFDSREESDYLPHTYTKNCVVYTGTHDNETIVGWYKNMPDEDKNFSIKYMNNENTLPEEIHWDFIRLAMLSVADTCIIPIQDYLGLDNSARINTPSTLGDNWKWRLLPNQISANLVEKIKKVTIISCRRV